MGGKVSTKLYYNIRLSVNRKHNGQVPIRVWLPNAIVYNYVCLFAYVHRTWDMGRPNGKMGRPTDKKREKEGQTKIVSR